MKKAKSAVKAGRSVAARNQRNADAGVPKPRDRFVALANDLLNVVACAGAQRLHGWGLNRSLATGKPLGSGPYRFDMGVPELCPGERDRSVCVGLSETSDPHQLADPDAGIVVSESELPEVLLKFRNDIDALLADLAGGTVIRRPLSIELEDHPTQKTPDAAVVISGGRRWLIGLFPWRAGDGWALSGETADEVARLCELASGGSAQVGHFGGSPALFIEQQAMAAMGGHHG